MRFYENIILDKNIKSLSDLMKSRIKMLDYYALCVSSIGNGIMEILSLSSALKDVNAYKDYGIIAVVKGKQAAENMSARLVEDWLKCNSNLKDFKEYYNNRCK